MDTRKHDILNILESRGKAKNRFERDMADKALHRIRSESKQVEEIRGNLIGAIRNNDRRAVDKFRQELMMVRADKTYGRDY
jgi:ABC-type histidine transport system ATPase subunit